jgi:hypothetical protein
VARKAVQIAVPTAAREPTAAVRRRLATLIERAAAGSLGWLHRLLLAGGYRLAWRAITEQELAEFFDVDRHTITAWFRRGCPRGSRSAGYDLRLVALWRLQQAETERAIAGNGDSRAALNHWKAKLEELKYKRARGDLVTRAEHEREVHARAAFFVANLEVLPDLGSAKGSRVRGRAALRAVLKELCDSVIALAYGAEEGGGEEEGTKARRHGGTKTGRGRRGMEERSERG